jgi:xanthine dehydrogenase accessory factor
VPAAAIARLLCPIGVGGVTSKWPAAIAVAVAFQLLRQVSAVDGEQPPGEAAPAEADCPGAACADCKSPGGACA